MNTIPLFKVDAFTERVFSGNPAAVCPLETWPDRKILQAIAAENNLSETAYFVKEKDGFDLRWFTPEAEVDLCGHATLATAFVLFNFLGFSEDVIRFYTNSGLVTVSRRDDLLTLDFPSNPLKEEKQPQAALLNALANTPGKILTRGNIAMAVYEKEEDVVQLRPDFHAFENLDFKIIYVTAPGNDVDFVSRVFAPALGINEDPVTGSAHCSLTPYWATHLGKKLLRAKQVSRRGGELICEDRGERTLISGKAVLFLKGEINLPL